MRGYCAVTADILHEGHIRFINKCRSMCGHLTVGVMSDECVKKYKGTYPIFNQYRRMEIISNLKAVDVVVLQKQFGFPILEDKETVFFDSIEHKRQGADCYLPRTECISSSEIKKMIKEEK